jgi:EAL domain-containing protein (putative c-di-GMP-specific phosphodiesterase class I)
VARWRRQHPHRDFNVAVNVSARQLSYQSFVPELIAILDGAGVPPGAVCLEVTESALLEEGVGTEETLRRLRATGVQIALDDFGTGYSSLTHLRRLPVDVLKIDRSFTKGIADDPHDRALVASVLGMARALGIEVVAEGVEDVAQRDELRRLGCRYAQGYLWSRPVPEPQASELLEHTFDVGDAV